MARPLRLQFAEALYHVVARGNARQDVFVDQRDRERFLQSLSEIAVRLDWQLFAYCLMDNHYHLLLETAGPSLAHGMRTLNSAYAQDFNRRHSRTGHVFQGRYHAVLVERDAYFLSVVRYIARNPVRAKLCERAAQWKWSSHRVMLGLAEPPAGFERDVVLRRFSLDPKEARRTYATFVDGGADEYIPAVHPLVAGDPAFAAAVMDRSACHTAEVTRAHRGARSLAQFQEAAQSRDDAICLAHESGTYSLADIARHFGLHYSTVSKICRKGRAR